MRHKLQHFDSIEYPQLADLERSRRLLLEPIESGIRLHESERQKTLMPLGASCRNSDPARIASSLSARGSGVTGTLRR